MKILGIVAMGVVRESQKFQGIHVQVAWGHCAVIFAIAQLSCNNSFNHYCIPEMNCTGS